MKGYNRAILIGRLGKDPEMKTAGQSELAVFSLATTESKKINGEWKDETQWHNIVVWGNLAKSIAVSEYAARKGDLVVVEGKIKYSQYQNQSGQTVYRTEIHADSARVAERNKASNENRQDPSYQKKDEYGGQFDQPTYDDLPF